MLGVGVGMLQVIRRVLGQPVSVDQTDKRYVLFGDRWCALTDVGFHAVKTPRTTTVVVHQGRRIRGMDVPEVLDGAVETEKLQDSE